MSSSPGRVAMFGLPIIIILVLLLCTAFILPLVLIVSDHSSTSPQNESEVAAMITGTAESYGLSLCESTPVEVSYAGVIDTMLYRYGLACGAYSMGNNLEVLIITFARQEDRKVASGKLRIQLAVNQAQGIVLVETGNYLIVMKGPASQSIQNKIVAQSPSISSDNP